MRARAWLPALIVGVALVAIGAMRAIPVTRVTRAHANGARPQPAATAVRVAFESNLDALAGSLDTLSTVLSAVSSGASSDALNAAPSAGRSAIAQRALHASRMRYKRAEYLIAYYAPTVASALNGPAEVDDPDLPPPPLGGRAGFASIEHGIEHGLDVEQGRSAAGGSATLAASLASTVRSLRGATKYLDVGDTATLDAARLELARVMTLGVAGFDGERPDSAMIESAEALEGVRQAIAMLSARGGAVDSLRTRAITLVREAAAYLRAEPRFDRFDRLTFIATRATPAARAVLSLRRAIDPAPSNARRLWRSGAATPFDRGAFDPWALAPEYAPAATSAEMPALVARGKALFFDPRLSGPGTRSCASCHQPSRAFADGRTRAEPLAGTTARLRNTPTLINAALQQSMFADQRAGFVEDQIRAVLSSNVEMASSPELAAARVGMNERELRVALAAYIRSLVALDSRFDRAVRGDSTAMTASERNGFNLFMGKARCGTCHFAPLFGGTMPPEFTRSELEIVGAPRGAATSGSRVDADSGRAAVDGAIAHVFAFRVPSVRNASLTAPYMHNGVYRTLDDVVDFYDRGGGVGIGERLPSQTLDARPLHLTPSERRDIVAFIASLADSVLAVAKP